MSRKVIVIQEHLPHYRKQFFDLAREKLERNGVSFDLIHGFARDSRFVHSGLQWTHQVNIHRLGPLLWHQDTLSLCLKSDLVIVAQETKYLISHLLQLSSTAGGPKFAFWGHGKNFQAVHENSMAECLKRFLATKVHWWFAYNDLSSRIVADLGFPKERITSVGNAIDTQGLVQARAALDQGALEELKASLGIHSDRVAVYTGGIYSNKRIPFLLEAARQVRAQIPDFHLLVIGDGPERALVTAAALANPWIHDLGSKNDTGKVPYWAISKVLLMPGGVGLVVVDSFALGVPMVTTDTHFHGPEIDYLKSGKNGFLVECGDNVEAYAAEVVRLFQCPHELHLLRQGALDSVPEHSIERMVENFAAGVIAALDAPRN